MEVPEPQPKTKQTLVEFLLSAPRVDLNPQLEALRALSAYHAKGGLSPDIAEAFLHEVSISRDGSS